MLQLPPASEGASMRLRDGMCRPRALLLLPLLLSGADASHIVGGHEARPHSHPYMAFLKVGTSSCGGFLVELGWVMTAARCMGNITVILGAHNIHKAEPSQQVRGVDRYHPHPGYDPNTYFNDLMVLKLTAKATLNDYVKTIPLPKGSSDLPTGTKCGVAGWGLIDDEQVTNKLFETTVSIYTRRSCVRFYPHLNAGMGDSGGPLVCNEVAQGIVSFGYDAPPGVYTRISNYLPWIRKTMEQLQLQRLLPFIPAPAQGLSPSSAPQGTR